MQQDVTLNIFFLYTLPLHKTESHRDLWSCPTSLVHAYLWIFHWCLFLQSSTERTMVSTKNRTPMGTATPTPTSICVSVLPVLRVLRTTARVRVNQGQITHYCAVCMWQSQSVRRWWDRCDRVNLLIWLIISTCGLYGGWRWNSRSKGSAMNEWLTTVNMVQKNQREKENRILQ